MTDEGPDGSAVLVQLVPMLILLLVMVALIVPYVRILRRVGRSGWWVLLLFIPLLGWVILPWVIAYMRWERPPKDLGEVFG
jgi:uncharacterized membrane protein YhaH (DUF805 family)